LKCHFITLPFLHIKCALLVPQILLAALIIARAITVWFAPSKPALYDSGGAAHPGIYGDCICGTVFRASAAFHAEVFIHYARFSVVHGKHAMGTNRRTHTASYALIVGQG